MQQTMSFPVQGSNVPVQGSNVLVQGSNVLVQGSNGTSVRPLTSGAMNVPKLIRLVEERSFIYDKSKTDFKNGMKKYCAWQEIATQLGVTMREAQNKWKLLREKYGKERRLIQRSGDYCDTNRGEWELYKLLKFLDPHIIGRRSGANFEPPSQFPLICQSQMSDSQDSVEYAALELEVNEVQDCSKDSKEHFNYAHSFLSSPTVSIETQERPVSLVSQSLNHHSSERKRKASSSDDTYMNSFSHLTDAVTLHKISKEQFTNEENEDSYFGKDIVSELSKMNNLKKKRQLKAKIYALISEYDSDD